MRAKKRISATLPWSSWRCDAEGLVQERQSPSRAAGVTLAATVADALDYAHRQGIMHRDVKPSNIMLTTENAVKVMDFGIARIASSTKTQTTMIMGTPSYMSPEQMTGDDVDRRADFFRLALSCSNCSRVRSRSRQRILLPCSSRSRMSRRDRLERFARICRRAQRPFSSAPCRRTPRNAISTPETWRRIFGRASSRDMSNCGTPS